ncbi:MAG TPA: hypothetical protein PL037_07400, partial [Elusimicrobiales bacterium]|nr:hypothetical protein [Elusimicrobiales bacterium]
MAGVWASIFSDIVLNRVHLLQESPKLRLHYDLHLATLQRRGLFPFLGRPAQHRSIEIHQLLFQLF